MLSYNGIVLEIVHTQEFTRQPVIRHNKYLYTRFILRCRVIFNPQATAYLLPGTYGSHTPKANVAKGQNVNAALTDAAIRHLIGTPRRQLIYTMPNLVAGAPEVEMLVSPPRRPDNPNQFYATDATNGPYLLYCNVVKWLGTKSAEVDIAWQTDIAECHLFTKEPSAVLDHSWSMRGDTNADSFTTRTIEGECIFNTARLAELKRRPDDFRSSLFHPCPVGFQRVTVNVHTAPDNSRLNYRVIDVERPLTTKDFAFFGVQRVEASHTASLHAPSIESQIAATAGAAIGIAGFAQYADSRWGRDTGGPQGGWAGGWAGNIQSLGAVMAPITRMAPVLNDALVIRVWGNANSTRKGLAIFANRFLNTLFAAGEFQGRAGAAMDAHLTSDLMGKFIELRVGIMRGPVASAVKGINAVGLWATAMNMPAYIPNDDAVLGVTTTVPGPNPGMMNHDNSRGSWLGALAAAALHDPCHIASAPCDPGNALPGDLPPCTERKTVPTGGLLNRAGKQNQQQLKTGF